MVNSMPRWLSMDEALTGAAQGDHRLHLDGAKTKGSGPQHRCTSGHSVLMLGRLRCSFVRSGTSPGSCTDAFALRSACEETHFVCTSAADDTGRVASRCSFWSQTPTTTSPSTTTSPLSSPGASPSTDGVVGCTDDSGVAAARVDTSASIETVNGVATDGADHTSRSV